MSRTDTIVAAYIDGMKARYAWAQQDNKFARLALEAGEQSARYACSGMLKLEGDAWGEALKTAGFVGPYTMKALAAFCAE